MTFYFVEKVQTVVQKTSRKNVMSIVFFPFFYVFFMDVMGGKITINFKEPH